MDTLYQKFYKGFYLRTGGFLPTKPLNQNIYPGDFFQIINGEIMILGNIFRKAIVGPEQVIMDYGLKLNPANWNFSDGVTKPYAGRESGSNAIEGTFEFSKQVLKFKEPGSYMFKGEEPESIKISNWSDIKDELIVKLTQTIYSFRELYLVTECATNASWTLAIASHKHAELEIATGDENYGLVDIFGHSSSRTIQSKNIEYYHRQDNRVPSFFKARKLVVQQEKLETFISELITQRMNLQEWADDFFDYNFESSQTAHVPRYTEQAYSSVLDMLQANQLNPNTALLYFTWGDMSLDDIQKLFITYGDE